MSAPDLADVNRRLGARGARFAIATPHVDATRAGVRAFDAGGTAVDAAIAAAAALAVAYPQMCGLGGDLFALIRTPDAAVRSINSGGRSPMLLDPHAVRREHESMPVRGPLTINVPGTVAGWAALHKLGGRLPWRDAFDLATALAIDGVTVRPGLAEIYRGHIELLAADPGARAVHTRDGAPLVEGDILRNPALGRSLDAIARKGPRALYGGDVGRAYADGLAELGSPMTIDDLSAHRAEVLPPLTGRYRDLEIATSPPTAQGFVMLQALAVIERVGIDPDPDGRDTDGLALAFVAAARDRDAHLADPDAMRVPVASFLAEDHLDRIAAEIRARLQRSSAGTPPLGGTAGMVAADGEGFAVSLIQSLSWGFGSGLLEPATGILAQNRGSGFVLDPDDVKALAPGRRPPHTLMPVMAHRGGRLAAISGTMGGPAHPQINAMSLIRALEVGMPAADAVAAPRWLAGGMDAVDGVAEAEPDVSERAIEGLRRAGLDVRPLGRRDSSVGHAHLIVVRDDGTFDVGTDPRADGEAAAS